MQWNEVSQVGFTVGASAAPVGVDHLATLMVRAVHHPGLGLVIGKLDCDETRPKVVRTNGESMFSFFEQLPPSDPTQHSQWYVERGARNPDAPEPSDPDERAGWLSAQHADSPSVAYLDSLGRPFLSVAHNVTGTGTSRVHAYYRTRTILDIEGNTLAIYDAKQHSTAAGSDALNPSGTYATITQKYDVLQRRLLVDSPDAGKRLSIQDAAGKPLRGYNARGFTSRGQFDAAQRPTHSWVHDGTSEMLVGRMVYGEELDPTGPSADPNSPSPAQVSNLRGQVYLAFDSAGKVKTEEVDFKGNVLKASRSLALEYQGTPTWNAIAANDTPANIESAASSLLESESFTSETTFDALNRVVSATSPASQTPGVTFAPSVTRPVYNEANLLNSLHVSVRGATESNVVNNLDYNARGQRTSCDHANPSTGSTSHSIAYTYDPKTFRLERLLTTRASDSVVLQDLRYTFDAVGNITEVQDHADSTPVFSGSAPVSGTGYYRYDALYRLTYAEGREHPGQQPTDTEVQPSGVPHPNDLQALTRYNETFAYDAVGNIDSVMHQGATGWTRLYEYATDSNRLLKTYGPSDIPGTVQPMPYDAHGSITQMPHLSTMAWDFADRLQHTERSGGGGQHTYFTYDASGERVRKVYEHSSIVEERIYLGGFEIYRKRATSITNPVDLERETLHVMDDVRRVAMVETKTVDTSAGATGVGVSLWRFQLSNHLDSASMELDEAAGVLSCEEYHPYGSTAFHSAKAGAEVSAKRYRYTGKERDEETGLYYHGARYYAPWLGRWTAADPAGLVDGLNLYRYSRDNPVTFSDPSGTETKTEERHQIIPPGVDTVPEFEQWAKGAGIEYYQAPEHRGGNDFRVGPFRRVAPGEGGQAEAPHEGSKAEASPAETPEEDAQEAEAPPAAASPSSSEGDGAGGKDDGNSTLDKIQLGLDIVGLIPGIGTAADIINASISLGRGDYLGAAVNLLGAIPGVGDAAKTAIKAGSHAADAAKAGKAAIGAGKEIAEAGVGLIGKKASQEASEQAAKRGLRPIARSLGSAGDDLLLKKAVNSNLPHAASRAVERGVFRSADEAADALRGLTDQITRSGTFPAGTLVDTARAGRFLVPIGNRGMAVYQLAKNGTAKLKTVLIAH